MHLRQIDVSSAYLNSDLHHEVYLKQPDCYIDQHCPHKVLKLKKAIYGLKQSGLEWYKKLNYVLTQMGFEQGKYEACFYKATKNNQLVIVAVYVDDLINGCKDLSQVVLVKKQLSENVALTDKSRLHHYLGRMNENVVLVQ